MFWRCRKSVGSLSQRLTLLPNPARSNCHDAIRVESGRLGIESEMAVIASNPCRDVVTLGSEGTRLSGVGSGLLPLSWTNLDCVDAGGLDESWRQQPATVYATDFDGRVLNGRYLKRRRAEAGVAGHSKTAPAVLPSLLNGALGTHTALLKPAKRTFACVRSVCRGGEHNRTQDHRGSYKPFAH